jgi:hypothetical protein
MLWFRRLGLLVLVPILMAAWCENTPLPPCTKRTSPDDPMDTFLYPEDCRPDAPQADAPDAGR